MAQFSYRARNQQGELVTGMIELADEQQVARNLDRLGYSVLEISRGAQSPSGTISELVEKFEGKQKQDIILFTRQLATLIRSGMPLLPALTTICEQTTRKNFKVILEDVRLAVQSGSSLSEALSNHPETFTDLFISMIRVGEAGGVMDEVLDRLAVLGTQEMEIQAKIRSAMTYPVVLVLIAFVIVNFILIGVLPKFVLVFKSSDTALPLPTQIVLGISWILRTFWPALLLGAAAAALLLRRYFSSERGRLRLHQSLLRVPVFGPLYSKIQIARFTRTLSTLTSCGVPLLQALTVVEKTVTNVILRRAIQNVRAAITGGSSLVEPFKASGLFSPMVVQMISIGEKSGRLDRMLEEVARFYEPEIENTVKNLTSLLEPAMLLAMGLMVAFIALSVLLPIFNLMSVFRA